MKPLQFITTMFKELFREQQAELLPVLPPPPNPRELQELALFREAIQRLSDHPNEWEDAPTGVGVKHRGNKAQLRIEFGSRVGCWLELHVVRRKPLICYDQNAVKMFLEAHQKHQELRKPTKLTWPARKPRKTAPQRKAR